MAHLLVSAAHKSSGKTTITLGLCAALTRRGLTVQSFKKGPDYIDPMWLSAATFAGRKAGEANERPCRNLDYYTMSRDEILATFSRHAHDADVSIIEGNKGLYDGLDLDGSNSNAALATLLGAPVVLVIDARGMTRGIAPLILGYQSFDPSVRISGVILNKIGGARHERKLRAIIEHYTDVPVLGAVHRDPRLEISERHLGLIPSNEESEARAKVDAIAEAIASQVNLDAVMDVARGAIPPTATALPRQPPRAPDLRIGIARDAVFGFYYPGDLEALEAAGAALVPMDMLHDAALPEIDGLFMGGGFPETHMKDLEANAALRHAVKDAIAAGLPAYAECGGLMYLARSLTWRGRTCEMAGAVPADVVMHETPQGRGYVRLRETGNGPWPLLDAGGSPMELSAHEFHYSSLENLDEDAVFAYEVLRGHGIDGCHDGLRVNNLLAGYAHM
ncbi:MAG TPA: cobyrinate a,c-diamide synthase, partial [Rhodospirillales bacterium]|nr:cobyrinate a,c-diamide synthase [Rhodospirillales bacterium]